MSQKWQYEEAPEGCPKRRAIRALEGLGFSVDKKPHLNGEGGPSGTKTPLTMPNHERIKGSTLRVICRQAGISSFQKRIEGKVQQHYPPREEGEILEKVRVAMDKLRTGKEAQTADAEHELELRTTPIQ